MPADASFPGANGKISFYANRDDPSNPDVYTINPDGSGPLRLTTAAGIDNPGFPGSFSADGQRIAFASTRDGNQEIYVMNADGSGQTRLTNNAASDASPAFSPDGQKIAFVSARDGNNEIYVGDFDGSSLTNQTRLTNALGHDVSPSFSPDGQKILFTSYRDGGAAQNGELYVMNANGSSQTRLTNDTVQTFGPAFSPDGLKIIFGSEIVQNDLATTELYVGDFDGSALTNVTRLTNNTAADQGAVVSPDGQKVAFTSNRDTADTWSVYTADFNGSSLSNVTRRTTNAAPDFAIAADWGPVPTPVIFIHGFLASKLQCSGAGELWPHIGVLDRPQLAAMELGADGVTEAGDGSCTGPVQTNGVVESVAGGDIHGSTLTFLNRIAPGANYVYAWDWRKSPEQALAGLDSLINTVRTANGGKKVAILAHSFGGLLTRWYIDDPTRAAKVKRALIAGTPSWGSPKALFPLATGQETPAFSPLDALLDNDALKSFARNLMGAYFLYPSTNYGTWLTVHNPTPSVLDTQQKVIDYVSNDLGGNGTLLGGAFNAHDTILDGWETNGVDVRALVGSGMNTITSVDLFPSPGGNADLAELHFGNGDETVPARSATQGTPGTSDPLGENIPIRYACNVSHVPLAGDAALTAAGAGSFLSSGQDLTASTQPCANHGFSVQFFSVDIGPAAATRDAGLRAGTGESLTDAEAAGDIDLIRFPGETFAVTDDFKPVTLDIPDPDAHVIVRRLDGETEGAPQSFGPFPNGIELKTTGAGTVTVGPIPETPPSGGGTTPQSGPTGQRAAALKKCKKKKTAAARKKCKRAALRLPA